MWASVAAALVVALWLTLAAPVAHADRAFGLRESFNVHGDVTGTGNTLLTCLDGDNLCPAARQGTAGNLGTTTTTAGR